MLCCYGWYWRSQAHSLDFSPNPGLLAPHTPYTALPPGCKHGCLLKGNSLLKFICIFHLSFNFLWFPKLKQVSKHWPPSKSISSIIIVRDSQNSRQWIIFCHWWFYSVLKAVRSRAILEGIFGVEFCGHSCVVPRTVLQVLESRHRLNESLSSDCWPSGAVAPNAGCPLESPGRVFQWLWRGHWCTARVENLGLS